MALRPWKILSSKHVYPNVRIDHCELPDGQVIEGFVLEYHDWATVVALTPDNQVVMERQYRHGQRYSSLAESHAFLWSERVRHTVIPLSGRPEKRRGAQ